MKTMTCRQLGGACDQEFKADTFDEMAALSKQHGMEMFQRKDPAHMQAMQEMQKLGERGEFAAWYEARQKEFDALPDQ